MINTLFKLATVVACIIGINIDTVEAQSGRFTQGYLVKNNGDTVSGYIQKWERERFPKEIKFKETLEAESVPIDPLTTKFFSLGSQIYESHILILDKSAYARNKLYVNHLPYHNKRTLAQDTVFLNVMVKGKVDLLYFI